MSEINITKKKKRGRKSKTDTVAKNVVIDESNYSNNLVIHLKKELNTQESLNEDTVIGYDPTTYSDVNVNTNNNISKCWNCIHSITQHIGIPLQYDNNVFHCYGDFCSFGCCSRYIIDNYHNNDLWTKFTLLNILYNQYYNTLNKKIHISPDRLLLDIFGGPLSIDEYRKENINAYDICIPPIIPVQHIHHKYDGRVKNDPISELRLYRKTEQNHKNNIFNSMNIKIKNSD